MQPTPRLAPRLSLTLILIFALGGIVRAQSQALHVGSYDIRDSAGNSAGILSIVSLPTGTTSGNWNPDIGGIHTTGTFVWDASAKTYHSFRNTEPPTPLADVWWDGVSGVWRWREIITGRTGTLQKLP